MKFLARLGLKALALFSPVVIAACYGPSADYENTKMQCGSVRDAITLAGITGIEVTCLQDGEELGMAYTSSAGNFCIGYPISKECKAVSAADVDGEQNGGTYLPGQMDTPADGSDVTIDLTK